MSSPSTLLVCALAAGLASGAAIDVPAALGLSLAMSAAWAGALLAWLRGYAHVHLASVALLVAGAGWLLGDHAIERALHPPLRTLLEGRFGGFSLDDGREVRGRGRLDEPFVVEGRLQVDAAQSATGVSLRLDVRRVAINGAFEDAAGGVAIGVGGAPPPERVAEWTAGRVIRAPVLLRRPARYLNEGVPDHERALARRGVALVGTIKSAALVEVVARGWWWEEAAARLRSRARAAMARYVPGGTDPSSSLATAILIGDRAGLPEQTEQRLQEAGTYHVVAISGGNIAILAGLLIGALRAIGVRGRLAALACIAVLTAYAIVASGGPSVARATLMAIVYLAVRLIDQRTAAASAVSLTAALVLITDPLAIADVGFWLTFGATVALIAQAAVPAERLRRASTAWASVPRRRSDDRHRRRPGLASGSIGERIVGLLLMLLMATICIEVALAPIGALVFQRVTVAGLPLNFIALPAMTVVQVGALAVVAFDLVNLTLAAAWCGWAVHVGATALVDSARLLDYAPWLTWRVPSPHVAVLTAYYVALALAVVLFFAPWRAGAFAEWAAGPVARRLARVSAAAAALLLLWIVVAPQARVRQRGDGRLQLTLFDVGQGDAMLVRFPNGRTLVVDGGGGLGPSAFDIGDRVLGPALRARGLLSLDYAAASHGDPDHIGGLRAMMRDFAPRAIWWGIPVAAHAPTDELRQRAWHDRALWQTLQRGDRVEFGDVEVRVHHPPPPDWERQRVRNNDSLVLELRFGRVSLLLTGDIDRDVERELVSMLDLLPITILKVAHHGSATSSSQLFLDHVRPRVALIGVGRGNPYGHPVPHVLRRLHDAGAEVFRTDLDGQIDVITDGQQVEVRTFTRRTLQLDVTRTRRP